MDPPENLLNLIQAFKLGGGEVEKHAIPKIILEMLRLAFNMILIWSLRSSAVMVVKISQIFSLARN